MANTRLTHHRWAGRQLPSRRWPSWAALVGIVGHNVLGAWAWGFDAVAIPPAAAAALSERTPRSINQFREIEKQVQRILPQVLKATVTVQAGRSAGSGVLIDKEGHVLTAAHVIGRPGRSVSVTLTDGRQLSGRSLGTNHDEDAGLVKLDAPPDNLPFLPIEWDKALRPGEWVITTGQPGGMIDDRMPPVRLGRVLLAQHDLICTDCTLVGGDSGGPLCNMRGEVVGIHSSIGPRIRNNFHVPLTIFRDVWDRLRAGDDWGRSYDDAQDGDEYPLLGIGGLTKDGKCVVTQVFEGMPADAAGVQPGDVIVEANGGIIKSMDSLIAALAKLHPGDTLRLAIERDGERHDITVKLEGIGEPLPGSPR